MAVALDVETETGSSMQPLRAGDGLTTPVSLGGDFLKQKLLVADHREERHEGFFKNWVTSAEDTNSVLDSWKKREEGPLS